MSEEVQKTPFEKFIENYNQDYIMKCKELGQKNEYVLEVDGKPVTFVRQRLTTRAFNDLEVERSKIENENMMNPTDTMENANRTANIYLKTAQAYLKNKETGQPITKEEYINTIWEDVKIILDSCHLRTMLGVPNAGKVSGT